MALNLTNWSTQLATCPGTPPCYAAPM